MNDADESYVKASDYSLSKQRHNHRVFARVLRSRPWLGVLLTLAFAALAIAVVVVPGSWPGGQSGGWRAWAVAGAAIGAALYLLVITFSRRQPVEHR